jgi:hypothetical protein
VAVKITNHSQKIKTAKKIKETTKKILIKTIRTTKINKAITNKEKVTVRKKKTKTKIQSQVVPTNNA